MTTGRPPKPSEFENAPGNVAATKKDAVSFLTGAPSKPWWYGEDRRATEEWDKIVSGLASAGVLSPLDGTNLATYAFNVSRKEQLERLIASPEFDSRERGRLAKEYKDVFNIVNTLSDKYGFTTLSRQKIGGTKAPSQGVEVSDGDTHGENVLNSLTGNA